MRRTIINAAVWTAGGIGLVNMGMGLLILPPVPREDWEITRIAGAMMIGGYALFAMAVLRWTNQRRG